MKYTAPLSAGQMAAWNLALVVLLLAVCRHTAHYLYPNPETWQTAGLGIWLPALALAGLLLGPLSMYRLWRPGRSGLRARLYALAAVQWLLWAGAYGLLFAARPLP